MAYKLYAKVTGPGARAGDGLFGGKVSKGFLVGEFADVESLGIKKQEMRDSFNEGSLRYRFTVEEFVPSLKVG